MLLLTTLSLAAPNNAYGQDTNQNDLKESQNRCEDCTPDEIIVAASRLSFADKGQQQVVVYPAEGTSTRLDQLLKSVPGVGLFRRADSFSAHPTIQGLSMRGVGANGAGRVLVTLDGVPLNDPFGGWIYWSAFDPQTIAELRVQAGGGAGAFGAQALAGSLDMRSVSVQSDQNSISGWVGENDAYQVTGVLTQEYDNVGLSLQAGRQKTDGEFLLAENQRGPIDARAASEINHASAKVEWQGDAVKAVANIRYYKEQRVNGLSLALNETEAVDVSLKLSGEGSGLKAWELVSYYRTRDFANMFVSARDDRTVERPVLDQFDVPAWGAGMLARVQFDGFEVGVDARRMSGETNERFRNLGAGFTRQRRAGGDQWIVGLYGEHEGSSDKTSYSATVRVDKWRTFNGERLETNIVDGSLVRSDDVPSRGDWIWSGRFGLEHELTGAVDVGASAYKSWRLPTLNEYYRPFRVVNDITEANSDLVPEKLYGIEVGFDYQPLNTAKLSATLFRNWLQDGVGNVTIGFGPGFFPLGGFVPAGGVLRQRANIDRAITDGLEVEGQLQLQNGWDISTRYLYARARITKFEARPELVGMRPVQTPRHSVTLAARYSVEKVSFNSELRYASGQYDDDLNTRRLGGIVTVNAAAAYRLKDKVSITANVENLFDAKVISAVTATGLETLAQRRFARIGLEVGF